MRLTPNTGRQDMPRTLTPAELEQLAAALHRGQELTEAERALYFTADADPSGATQGDLIDALDRLEAPAGTCAKCGGALEVLRDRTHGVHDSCAVPDHDDGPYGPCVRCGEDCEQGGPNVDTCDTCRDACALCAAALEEPDGPNGTGHCRRCDDVRAEDAAADPWGQPK